MFKMLTNNFYRGFGFLVMGSFYQTQFYLFLPYLFDSPCVSFPSTQCYFVSLNFSLHTCYFAPSLRRAKIKKFKKQSKKSTVPLKCLSLKSFSSDLLRAQIIDVTMLRTGTPYCREDDLCSDAEDGGLIADLSSMKCRRSAMPPMLHTRDAVQVEIVTMSVQCDLGRESLKFLMPRPSTPAPSSTSTSSKKKS